MKEKYVCPYCGQINSNKEICINCNHNMHIDMFKDEIQEDYFNIKIFINNNDFYKILDICKKYPNNLYYEYFKMYASLSLEKEYNQNTFFQNKYTYTSDELNNVCYHLLEKKTMYDISNIKEFYNKYDFKDKEILNKALDNEFDEQVMEKDLREELFPLTKTLPVNQKIRLFKHGNIYLLILSFILLILFTGITLIVTEKELQYEMLIVALIIPTIFLSKSFTRIVIKKNNLLINIIVFLVIYYMITYLITLPFHEFNLESLYIHLKRIIFTPFVLVKTMHERMN